MTETGTYPVIEQMYAFLAQDEEGEGVVSIRVGDQHYPMVGADMARVDQFRPLARQMAQQTGVPIRVVTFTTRTEIEVIEP